MIEFPINLCDNQFAVLVAERATGIILNNKADYATHGVTEEYYSIFETQADAILFSSAIIADKKREAIIYDAKGNVVQVMP